MTERGLFLQSWMDPRRDGPLTGNANNTKDLLGQQKIIDRRGEAFVEEAFQELIKGK